MSGKLTSGLMVTASAGLMAFGSYEGMSAGFNRLSHSPNVCRFAIEFAAAAGSALLSARGMGTLASYLHHRKAEFYRAQQIDPISYAVKYVVAGLIGGALGGWFLADKLLPPVDSHKTTLVQPERTLQLR